MREPRHPYEQYEQEAVWRVLERGIKAMVKNGDIGENTAREYVVGYLAKLLTDAGFRQVSELRSGDRTLRVVEVKENGGRVEERKRAGVA